MVSFRISHLLVVVDDVCVNQLCMVFVGVGMSDITKLSVCK
jgi:hypothetical protein